MASALRQEWILIRRLGESAAQRCVLPARSAGQVLCRRYVRWDVSESGERPHRGREAATLGQSGQLSYSVLGAVAGGKSGVFEVWPGGHIHGSAWR